MVILQLGGTILVSALEIMLFSETRRGWPLLLPLNEQQITRIEKGIYLLSGMGWMTVLHWPKIIVFADKWVKKVREEEFLVSRQLRNYVDPALATQLRNYVDPGLGEGRALVL